MTRAWAIYNSWWGWRWEDGQRGSSRGAGRYSVSEERMLTRGRPEFFVFFWPYTWVNGGASIISFLVYLLCRNKIDFCIMPCILQTCWIHLLVLTDFLVDFLYTKLCHLQIKVVLFISFQPLISFSFLIILVIMENSVQGPSCSNSSRIWWKQWWTTRAPGAWWWGVPDPKALRCWPHLGWKGGQMDRWPEIGRLGVMLRPVGVGWRGYLALSEMQLAYLQIGMLTPPSQDGILRVRRGNGWEFAVALLSGREVLVTILFAGCTGRVDLGPLELAGSGFWGCTGVSGQLGARRSVS